MPDVITHAGVIWIPLLPLLAASWIALGYVAGFNRGENGERHTTIISLLAVGISLLLLLATDIRALLTASIPGQVTAGRWLSSGDYEFNISFTLDTPGLAFATLIAFIVLLTMKFSVNYMHREGGYQRYFIVLNLFMAAMLLIALGGNALIVFVGWELAGVCSYLLIAYACDRNTATRNAGRVFITNRIGDAAFLFAIALSLFMLGSTEWPVLTTKAPQLGHLIAGFILIGFVTAALVKSAQVPFSPWIARALEGPTPSSAVFYGSLMVHAGVFLLLRLAPVIEQAPAILFVLAASGASTAIYGYLVGLVQTDVKSSLIFSTIAQVGLMVFSCGLGWFEFAGIHLLVHAVWRSYQFLHAPAMMHMMHAGTRPVPRWLQHQRWLYNACLQRFWLDNIADWLLTRPLLSLVRDMESFDDRVVNRMVGLPESTGAVSSLAQWEARKNESIVDGDTGTVGRGRGVAGKLLEWVASRFHWFEERLVLQDSERGMNRVLRHVGTYLIKIDELLSQPRYLLLMIILTFVVIL